ncbi:MAG: dienelactone hydrolase family protein [Anaerolineae bacterium]|jgi:predicted peptidase
MKFRSVPILFVMAMLCPLLGAACSAPPAEPVEPGQHALTAGRGRSRVNYLLFLPQEYGQEPGRQWPLMVFLHGIAKRGDSLEELEELKKDGPPMIVEQEPDFPFIVLSPQCPSDSFWESQLGRLDSLVEEILATYDVDERRIYLTGLSMGGYGVWHYALKDPARFAAVVPIAGGYVHGSDEVPASICDLQDVPIWVFHGAGDDVVMPRQSEVLVDALRACPSEVRFTLYPGAAHDESWKMAYADPELYEWMLAQRLEE